ncbi:hypothetical protein CBR_g1007 [Chara braunii]|uniref:Uncharacterized protein n=1 Tax=Chara braunii TaxID=69332 RepID=A0A388KCU8_CHABU|nr:hypothetical protein CBR_g1007 [Chara braunii]|eukprot:GBG67888.1 hypothetical protein CBR_g1007 [Chara braunii]
MEVLDQSAGAGQANGRMAVPPTRADIPMSDEDRMEILIAKCYEDGIIPEKFCHGEWVVEGGVRLFRVNTGLDTLVTSWLKERTVTVIFQGEARDLPLRIREDLVRAYENGWYRERVFDRSVKRGRIHGEGPNILSYVAKSGEVARWMIAKGEDKVVIRGIEYGMAFKPWMTKAELVERRRSEDVTNFWVMALRVPLRVMFHVESMVESAMGRIINSLPPEPDKSRPKLMNLKFELAREAEDRFEEELPIKLDDGEIYHIKFACKNTPWCDMCCWYFHTATEGCPRMGEFPLEQRGESEIQRNNERRRRGGEANGGQNRSIREATRDIHVGRGTTSGAGSSSHGNHRFGEVQPIRPQGLATHMQGGTPNVQRGSNFSSSQAHQVPPQGVWQQRQQQVLPSMNNQQAEIYQLQTLFQLLNQDPTLSTFLPMGNTAMPPTPTYQMSPQLFGNYQYMHAAVGYQGHTPSGQLNGQTLGPQRSFVPYQGQHTEQRGQVVYQGDGIGPGTDGVKEIHQVQAGDLHHDGNPSCSRDPSGSEMHISSPTYIPGGVEAH